MDAHLRSRRVWLLIPLIGVAGVLAVWGGGAAATASIRHASVRHATRSSLAGTWAGRYSGAVSGTFKLHWKKSGSKLHGSITLSNPRGKYGVTGSLRGSKIKFGAVSVGATYTGAVSGRTMSGRYRSPQGNGRWRAHKIS